MKKSSFLPTKITMAGIVLLTGLAGNSAWAACTTNNVFGVPVSVNVNCVAQVNTNTTAIATTNTNLATTNSNLATTNTNLATTDANLIAGDAATLSSSKAYTDGKAYAVGADTLRQLQTRNQPKYC
ncbi:MAG: hypothetical protein V9E91_13875 [Burkholderiaceae bacterium]